MNIIFISGVLITVVSMFFVLRQLKDHPKGLAVLFFAEMWERFSFYGMRGLLVLYMTQHFLMSDEKASDQYGAYTALVYLLPILGGFLADRYLGARKAVAFGALLLVAGHTTMAIEGKPATQTLLYNGAEYEFVVTGRAASREVKLKFGDATYEIGATKEGGFEIKGLPQNSQLPTVLPKGTYEMKVKGQNPFYEFTFFMALSLIISGVGFLKANISSLVGQLYPHGDPRRDPGFTLYYYGINMGALWAVIGAGWLGQTFGWWAGFGAAGLGMIVGWVVFLRGKPLLEGKGEPPEPDKLSRPLIGPINTEWLIYILSIIGVLGVFYMVQHNDWVGNGLGVITAIVLSYFAFQMWQSKNKTEILRLILALILICASIVFWTLFEQAGSSLTLFAERNTIRDLPFGQVMTTPEVQIFNQGSIIVMVPAFSALWAWLGARNMDPNPIMKFSIGLILVGVAFLMLVLAPQFANSEYKVPLIFLAGSYIIQSMGELCLSPVGLSWMTKLAPVRLISTLMATWFLATAWAQFVAAKIAKMASVETVAGQVLDPQAALKTYVTVFGQLGFWTVIIGIGFALSSPFLIKLAQGEK